MIASERFSIIQKIVNEKKFISTKELSEQLNVTETTIRRDCEELHKQGLIIRVHGGAKSVHQKNFLSKENETRMSERYDIHKDEKEMVAKQASNEIHDGDCIFLDGGTSIVPMVKYIKDKKIIIVTHSSLIVDELQKDSNVELFIIGGKYLPAYNMSVGPLAISNIEKFNFDHAFISCAGIDLERKLLYTVEMETMEVKQKAMHVSTKTHLLIDSSKLDVKSFCSFIHTDDFDSIYCDENDSIVKEDILENMILVKKEID